MMKPVRRLWVHAVVVAVTMVVVGIGTLVVRRFSPPFDLALLHQLRWGMSEEEVQAILGPPTTKSRFVWVYGSPGPWPRVKVDFDGNGTFARSDFEFF